MVKIIGVTLLAPNVVSYKTRTYLPPAITVAFKDGESCTEFYKALQEDNEDCTLLGEKRLFSIEKHQRYQNTHGQYSKNS